MAPPAGGSWLSDQVWRAWGQGMMPGFASSLKEDDILDIIAWFQSQWTDDINGAWVRIELKSKQGK